MNPQPMVPKTIAILQKPKEKRGSQKNLAQTLAHETQNDPAKARLIQAIEQAGPIPEAIKAAIFAMLKTCPKTAAKP
ncbi:MAG: hypothetical protein HY040_27570 [Planctomycetes bacterium]|nr:hypothetical protein [Planctomycetota bacterium]